MLFTGAGAYCTSALGGALSFDVFSLPSTPWWFAGSAYNFDMLVAGADVGAASARGGALSFSAADRPSATWWGTGSAIFSLLVEVCN